MEASDSPAVPSGLEEFYGLKVSWKDCEEDGGGSRSGPGFQCATVKVPLDYDDPSGKTVDLALKKLPSGSGQPVGTLFVNPGGPGGSGVDMVSQAEDAFSQDLRAGFDIVGFDPRGVGASTPVSCLSPEDAAEAAKGATTSQEAQYTASSQDPTPQPSPSVQAVPSQRPSEESAQPAAQGSEEESAAAAVLSGQEVAADCARYSAVPEILDHMDTASVARDLDVLRGLSGDPRLYYLGTSYGTYLGARYAELFPANVGRMLLDSAQDPSLSNAQVAMDQAVARENAVRAFVESCQKSADCPLGASGSRSVDEGMAQLRSVIEKADASPVPTSQSGVTLDGQSISVMIGDLMLHGTSVWEPLTSALTRVVNDNDATELAALAEPAAEEGDADSADPEKQAQAAANQSAISAVDCLDYPVQGDEATWDEEAAQIRDSAPTMGEGSAYVDAFCQGWGHHSDHQPSKVTASGAAPVMVIGVTTDPATPYHWAQALADQLESGHLLTVRGVGHGAYQRLGGSCTDDAVDSYLLRGQLPEEGLVCEDAS